MKAQFINLILLYTNTLLVFVAAGRQIGFQEQIIS